MENENVNGMKLFVIMTLVLTLSGIFLIRYEGEKPEIKTLAIIPEASESAKLELEVVIDSEKAYLQAGEHKRELRKDEMWLVKPAMAQEVEELPISVDEELVNKLVYALRWRESTHGKYGLAKTCAEKGMWNEIGWQPSGQLDYCFPDEATGVSTLKKTIEKYVPMLGVKGFLCRHKTGNPNGTPTNSCEQYVQDIRSYVGV
jgi:hypothetical protein